MEITINGKKYKQVKQLSALKYQNYLRVRDTLFKKENENIPYTEEDLLSMCECICNMYDNAFTVDELLESSTISSIMIRFGSFDKDVVDEVDNKIAKMKEGFQKHK